MLWVTFSLFVSTLPGGTPFATDGTSLLVLRLGDGVAVPSAAYGALWLDE